MNSTQLASRVSQWCYQGLWALITYYLRVPPGPEEQTGAEDRHTTSFRPALGFLGYLKFLFWLFFLLLEIPLVIVWFVILANAPAWVSVLVTPLFLISIVAPPLIGYVAIHLRCDTTWYTLSDRSMRIRRGIWTIHETTITYENIQNVSVNQGPVQRYFGISNVSVETAGGGAVGAGHATMGHHGLLEGVDCAEEIRNLILLKWKESKSTGLGDEAQPQQSSDAQVSNLRGSPGSLPTAGFTPSQIDLLEQIRDLAVKLAG
jgi:membrane protein YdbS with pleckstrin-like domain